MAIKERIKEARGGLSQKAFSDQVGVSERTVQNWEYGKRTPDSEQLVKLVNATGRSSDWFLFGVETTEAVA